MKYQNIGLADNAFPQISIDGNTNLKTALEALLGTLLTGTVTAVNGSKALTGSGTSFSNEVKQGSYIIFNGERHRVLKINSDTSVELEVEASADFTGAFNKSFDFNSSRFDAIEISPQQKIRYAPDGSVPSVTKGLPMVANSLRSIRGESINNFNMVEDSTSTAPVLVDIQIGKDSNY